MKIEWYEDENNFPVVLFSEYHKAFFILLTI